MAKVLDEESRKAVAATVRYYRDLGIYDLYRREAPEGASLGRTIVREALAAMEECAESSPHSPNSGADVGHQAAGGGARAGNAALPAAGAGAGNAALPAAGAGALGVIREDIGDCTRCRLSQGRTNIVFGVGDASARILFVGEGPGADEDARGEPFVGRAGQLLNNMIQAMGIGREDVYIANVVKCRPPDNRAPERDECEMCGQFLLRQIAVVRPEIIVALGATAARFLLGATESMAKLRGHIYDFRPAGHAAWPPGAPERDAEFAAKLVVTYHPAYLLRDPRQKKEAWQDLQMVMEYLGMPLPRRNPEG